MWCYGADIVKFPVYYSLGESKSTTHIVCYTGPQTCGPEMTKPLTDHPILVVTPPLSCYVNVSRSSRCFSAFVYVAWKKKKWKKTKQIIFYFLNFNWHNMGHPYSLPMSIMGFCYWSNVVVRQESFTFLTHLLGSQSTVLQLQAWDHRTTKKKPLESSLWILREHLV